MLEMKGDKSMITYRFATLNDIGVLIDRRLQFLEAKTDESTFYDLFQNTRNFMEKRLNNGDIDAILVCDGEKIVGEGIIYYYDSLPTLMNIEGKSANLFNIYVENKYRHNGIASEIIKRLLDVAKMNGVKEIICPISDLSRNLFEKFNFTKVHNNMIYQFK